MSPRSRDQRGPAWRTWGVLAADQVGGPWSCVICVPHPSSDLEDAAETLRSPHGGHRGARWPRLAQGCPRWAKSLQPWLQAFPSGKVRTHACPRGGLVTGFRPSTSHPPTLPHPRHSTWSNMQVALRTVRSIAQPPYLGRAPAARRSPLSPGSQGREVTRLPDGAGQEGTRPGRDGEVTASRAGGIPSP